VITRALQALVAQCAGRVGQLGRAAVRVWPPARAQLRCLFSRVSLFAGLLLLLQQVLALFVHFWRWLSWS
jgi:hypothetical protein